MPHHEAKTAATPEVADCWTVLIDVLDWPQWTESISAIDGPEGPCAVDSKYRVTQPGMPRLTWTVTQIEPGRGFTWSTSSPGVRTVGRHWISTGDGPPAIRVSVEQTGPLAAVVWWLTGRRTRRYLQLEADGLADASRAAASRRDSDAR